MSEDTTNPQVETPEEEVVPKKFEIQSFEEGDFAGFKFTVVTFGTLDAIKEHFGDKADDVIISFVNQQVAARIRTKVKNGLPKGLKGDDLNEHRKKLLERSNGTGILFDEAKANEWRPDQREVVSPTKLFKLAQEAMKKGDVEKGMRLLNESIEAAKQKFNLE